MDYFPVRYVKQPEGISLRYSLVGHQMIPVAGSDLGELEVMEFAGLVTIVVGRRVSTLW